MIRPGERCGCPVLDAQNGRAKMCLRPAVVERLWGGVDFTFCACHAAEIEAWGEGYVAGPELPAVEPLSCAHPVLNEQKRARPCGAPTVAVRTVYEGLLRVCVKHAVEIDDKRPRGPLSPAERAGEELLSRAKWDAYQAKLPPGQRRSYDQSERDDHAALARGYRKMAAEDRAPAKPRRSRKKGGSHGS